MRDFEKLTDGVAGTHEFASEFAARLGGGQLVGLFGGLGAGKSEFARGVLKAVGVQGRIQSPSYPVEIVYEVEAPGFGFSRVHHFDCYRLSGSGGLEPFRELSLDNKAVALIEWPERVEGLESLLFCSIQIDFGRLEGERKFDISYSENV